MVQNNSFIEQAEQREFLRTRVNQVDRADHVFKNSGSAGWQNKRLAQLTTTFDYVMSILKWDVSVQIINGKPIVTEGFGVTLTKIVKTNQATIDAKYHNDYVKVALSEEKTEKASRIGIAGNQSRIL